jgi:hypothetical protein
MAAKRGCPECPLTSWRDSRQLREHLMSAHALRVLLTCCECRQQFHSREDPGRHLRQRHSDAVTASSVTLRAVAGKLIRQFVRMADVAAPSSGDGASDVVWIIIRC